MAQKIVYYPPEEKPHKRDCSCYGCEVTNRLLNRIKRLNSLPKEKADRLRELYRKMDGNNPMPNIRHLMASCFDKGGRNY